MSYRRTVPAGVAHPRRDGGKPLARLAHAGNEIGLGVAAAFADGDAAHDSLDVLYSFEYSYLMFSIRPLPEFAAWLSGLKDGVTHRRLARRLDAKAIKLATTLED